MWGGLVVLLVFVIVKYNVIIKEYSSYCYRECVVEFEVMFIVDE